MERNGIKKNLYLCVFKKKAVWRVTEHCFFLRHKEATSGSSPLAILGFYPFGSAKKSDQRKLLFCSFFFWAGVNNKKRVDSGNSFFFVYPPSQKKNKPPIFIIISL